MNHLRPFLQKTLPTSLVPLLLSGSFYLFGGTIPKALSGAYDGYFQFMFTMMAINIILKAFSVSSNAALKKLKASSDLFQTEELSREALLKDAMSTVLHYTVAYGIYCAFGLYISSLSCGSVIQCLGLPQNEVALPSDILLNQENLPLVRLLEGDVEGEEEKEANSVYFGEGLTAPHKDELKSLSVSVGKVLGSLNIDVYSIVISADETLAYALTRDSGALKIVSISNLREPVLIASLALSKPSFNFFHRYLKLSHDGATLFASSFQLLEIIDVSESEAPRLLSRIKDENLQDSQTKYDIDLRNYRISMALSLNQETLYVAGLGLQIFNVADLSAPVLVHSATKEPETIYDLAISSLALSEDGETLFYANGALTIYSTETPHDLKVLKTFFAPDSSHYSIALSSDSQALYLTGSEYNGAVLQIVDVSKPSEPTLLKTFELNLGEKSYGWPLIMGVNPEGTHVFLEMNNDDYSTNLNVFNLITGKQLSDRKSLIPEASSVVFLRDYNKMIAAANNQFLTLGLYLNYPNSRTFSLSNNTVTTFSTSGKADSFVLSPDGKTLFILQSNTYSTSEENAFLEVFDLTDPSKPRKISTTAMPKGASSLQISLSSKKAFIALDTMFEIYDISDLTSIQPEKNIDLGAFRIVEEFIMSSDGKTGYVLQQINPEHVTLKIFDFITRKEIPNNILPQGGLGCKMVLSRDNNNLFLMKDELSIYDVSDLAKISKIASVSLPLTDADPLVEAFAISPDNKILYFTTFESGNMNKLRAFDIQVLTAPVELTEFLLPHFEFESASIKPVVSADSKKISIVQSQGILELDVSSPSSPKIIGVIPVSTTDEISSIKQFVISPDGKFGFITTQKKNEVRVLNLQQKHSLFFAQESFPLGQKISDSILVFAFDETEQVYLPIDQEDYKFIKNSLYSIHIDPTKPMTQNTLSPLPSWIVVDRESSIVTIEPKRSRDIGSFTIYSALSKKLTLDSFKKIELGNLNSEDLVILLISLGYLDSQLFLTANFGAYKDFLLTSQFTPYKVQIYSFLKQHLIETCTTLDVAPSLNVISTERLFIFTPSYNAIKVDITLKGDAKPKFLRRTFGSLEPIILDDKSRIILEGPLKDVDQAIQQLVIDLDNTGACDGVITVNDNLNPIVTRSIANLCSYFRTNIVPYASLDEELTLQNQIDRVNIQTGKYFEIAIHNETFIDENNGPISYALTMQDTKKPLPNWISIEGHVLKGTPPEELFGRSLGLILHVSNEFKVLRVHFRIGADISGAFLFKILLKLSPYLLTALGLWVSANKIYNVVYKDEYKNGKQFLVGVGEEINSAVIFPIYFVLEEKGEAELILRHLMEKVSKDVHKRSISNYEFAKHFFVNDELNKVEILRTINEVVSNLSEKEQSGLKIYTQGAASRKLVVTQLVINQLVDYLLASNRLKETKAMFEKIKSRWSEMIEWNSSQLFVCSDLKLENVIGDGSSGSDANQRLLGNNGNVNKDLLKNAIASHAFECQSLETLAIRVHILAKEKVGNDQIKGYLKLDLEEINFNERGRADYGVDYKIKNSALCFSGTVQEDFKGKTMVIQLTNLKQKILKEVWISEDASKSGFTISEFIPSHQEQVQKGQGYEIY